MLEFYQAYTEYHELMDLTEEMLRGIAQEVVRIRSLLIKVNSMILVSRLCV